ncbi:MAG TPA: alpha/beta fold hydrolase [Mycobacteriales bacterium]
MSGTASLPFPAWPGEVRAAGRYRLFVRAGGAGEPAVYVHGLGGSSTNWTDLMGLLDFDGLAPDLPGHGRSPAAPDGRYRLSTHVAAVTALIESTGRGPVHLFGNSLGGAASTLVAAQRPDLVRSLTLISPAFPQLDPRRIAEARMALLLLPGAPWLAQRMAARVTPEQRVRAVLELCYADPSRITAERMDEAVADARRHAEDDWAERAFVASARGLVASYLLPGRRSLWSAAGRVTAPVTLIWGAQDALVPVSIAPRVRAAFTRAAGGATLDVFEDAGHVAQMELPERTASAVRRHTTAQSA